MRHDPQPPELDPKTLFLPAIDTDDADDVPDPDILDPESMTEARRKAKTAREAREAKELSKGLAVVASLKPGETLTFNWAKLARTTRGPRKPKTDAPKRDVKKDVR